MSLFHLSAALLAVVAVLGYINHRFIRLPDTIGITAVGFIASIFVSIIGLNHPEVRMQAEQWLASIDFYELMIHGMLPLLLFAGALHIDVSALRTQKLPIFMTATVGVAISAFAVGFGTYYLLQLVGMEVPLIYCLVFGALISPTDPIAVLSILKRTGAPPALGSQIAGESLFNDGTAVVLFVVFMAVASGSAEPSATGIGMLLFVQILGGLALGTTLGLLGHRMICQVRSYPIEIISTLALALGGFAVAEILGVSAPLTVIMAGLVVGNRDSTMRMTRLTREHLFSFWEMIDEILNLILFGLIGLQVIVIAFDADYLIAGAIMLVVVLAGRVVSVGASLYALRPWIKPSAHAIKIMTWGGLRGGVSIALALSLPEFDGRNLLVAGTYMVVVFSLLVQATTLGSVIRHLSDEGKPEAAGR